MKNKKKKTEKLYPDSWEDILSIIRDCIWIFACIGNIGLYGRRIAVGGETFQLGVAAGVLLMLWIAGLFFWAGLLIHDSAKFHKEERDWRQKIESTGEVEKEKPDTSKIIVEVSTGGDDLTVIQALKPDPNEPVTLGPIGFEEVEDRGGK